MKNVYFLSDAHLGSLAIKHNRTHERRLVRFLDEIKYKASAVYLLGDMFDFWNEYKYVVPKGFTRFLGKLSELTDMGVEVHFFVGNHDLWTYGYLEKECGVMVHKTPEAVELYDKVFFLGHGDGVGDDTKSFKLLRAIFHNKTCQMLLNAIHPRWGMWFGLTWAKNSRIKHSENEPKYMGEDKEHIVVFSKKYAEQHKNIDYFIFGHRHIKLDVTINDNARVLILGDWIKNFTYAMFDGEHLFLEDYIEGDSKL